MPKKVIAIFLTLILTFLLTSCGDIDLTKNESIIAPNNLKLPLTGKWKTVKIITDPNNLVPKSAFETDSELMAVFSEESIAVLTDYALNPTYRTRTVSLSNYLSHYYNTMLSDLDLEEKSVTIVSVFGKDKMPYEFIKYDDKSLIFYNNSSFYFLENVEKSATKEDVSSYMEYVSNELDRDPNKDAENIRSSLLLGVRNSYRDSAGNNRYDYRTYLICFNNTLPTEILSYNSILIPRKRGFWSVETKIREEGDFRSELVTTNQLITANDSDTKQDTLPEQPLIEYPVHERIDYVSGNYVSIERENTSTGKRELRLLKFDNMEQGNYLNIQDILEKPIKEMVSQTTLKSLGESYPTEVSDYDFGLRRNRGQWHIFGRAQIEDGKNSYIDFELDYLPPKEIVYYNEQFLSWDSIHSSFPEATDAFSSPLNEVIIVKMGNSIVAYPIENKVIRGKVLFKLNFRENSEIVMSEWTTGGNTAAWTDVFIENGANILDY